jgi:hypothetical protein
MTTNANQEIDMTKPRNTDGMTVDGLPMTDDDQRL